MVTDEQVKETIDLLEKVRVECASTGLVIELCSVKYDALELSNFAVQLKDHFISDKAVNSYAN